MKLTTSTTQEMPPNMPIKIPISSPVVTNTSQQYDNTPHTFSNLVDNLNRQPHLINSYNSASNFCCDSIEDTHCIHNQCQLNEEGNDNMEDAAIIMHMNSLDTAQINHPDKFERTLDRTSSINLETIHRQPSIHSLHKPFIHHQTSPLLTTLLPPLTSINANDVVMTSSTTLSLLRSVSPTNLLPEPPNSTNFTHTDSSSLANCIDEDRKPYINGDFDTLREDSVTMSTLENNHCPTLLF